MLRAVIQSLIQTVENKYNILNNDPQNELINYQTS